MKTEDVEFVIAVCSVLFMMAFLAMLYTVYIKLEEIESYLVKNTIAMDTKKSWGLAGYAGRLVRLAMILASLVFAAYWRKRELLDLAEVYRMPKGLRRWVYIPFFSAVSLLLCMAVLLTYIGKI